MFYVGLRLFSDNFYYQDTISIAMSKLSLSLSLSLSLIFLVLSIIKKPSSTLKSLIDKEKQDIKNTNEINNMENGTQSSCSLSQPYPRRRISYIAVLRSKVWKDSFIGHTE